MERSGGGKLLWWKRYFVGENIIGHHLLSCFHQKDQKMVIVLSRLATIDSEKETGKLGILGPHKTIKY